VEQLEQQMSTLIVEKDKLINERENMMAMLSKLISENSDLKSQQTKTTDQKIHKQVEKERLRLLQMLAELIKNNAPDEAIEPILKQIKEECKKVNRLGQCHLQQLLSPSAVSELVDAGFFESPIGDIEVEQRRGSIMDMVNKIFKNVHTLTQDQKDRINALVVRHYQKIDTLRTERQQINGEVAKFFDISKNTSIPTIQPPDKQALLNTVAVLELLRKNLAQEADQWEESMSFIEKELTPRQEAEFFLKIEVQHASVLQLKALWNAMNSKNLDWACKN